MNYAVIKKFDIANGAGVRVSLFVSGCRHHCKNCFNKEAWDFNYGKPFTKAVADEILTALSPDYITGFSLLGGEPFEPENQVSLANLLKQIKQTLPNKDIWCYTGFLYEDIIAGRVGDAELAKTMLQNIDVLVDGKFIEDLKRPDLLFRGSSNQRIIDMKKTLEAGSVVWLEGKWERRMGSGNIYD